MKLTGPQWAVSAGATLVLAVASAVGVHYEGTRYTAYQDVGQVWTICQGHTADVQPGDQATEAQCRAWLAHDMGSAYADVQRCITAPLTIGQAAAFTDAVYNAGAKVVCGSTLQRLANAGDLPGACAQLKRWVKAAGQTMAGLVRRREAEYQLCMEGVR